ncbi:hypothetical protein AUJ59_01815 [Candidatus Beckwithbacteria bacterium CG1_02_47_37]|uniref:Uncharacterized protein n=1 Tax=Candidatus Beckwithbacteria bacterium CG1_02_47_37 TaxID=1805034 RepID=A0A1J4RQL5_9BACT|nr:MAG: hypothetical protein AUJ59_01815 [Candidatus Beckwithbacteria bacterium CG1_02_47_37]
MAAVSGSAAMVLFLGLGIRPLGPKILAYLASLGIIIGAAIKMSKSILLSLSLTKVFSEAISTLTVLPVPWGSWSSPPTLSTSRFRWSSTDGSNLTREIAFNNLTASSIG